MARRIMHLVVGAGIPIYFKNCIDSVVRLSGDPIVAIYNYLGAKDRDEILSLQREFRNKDVHISIQPNASNRFDKTGSLYHAYNWGLQRITREFPNVQFLNILQSDMQLMWWSESIEGELDTIGSVLQMNGLQYLCASTAISSFGKLGLDYENGLPVNVFSNGVRTLAEGAMADVGILNLEKIQELNFRFQGTERALSEQLSEHGFVMPKLKVPIAAFIPFPVTVRQNRVCSSKRLRSYSGVPLLQSNHSYDSIKDVIDRDPENELWMEDFVFPSGWNTLTPYWLTDTLTTKWMRRRISLANRSESAFLRFVTFKKGELSFSTLPIGRTIPSRTEVVTSALKFAIQEFRKVFGCLLRRNH